MASTAGAAAEPLAVAFPLKRHHLPGDTQSVATPTSSSDPNRTDDLHADVAPLELQGPPESAIRPPMFSNTAYSVTIAGRGQRARFAAGGPDPVAARDGACHHSSHA